jgi:hypothetical protein
MEEHNFWMPQEKATYLITALNEPAAHILHGAPTAVSYGVVTQGLENHYADHYLEALFHSHL